MGSLFRAAPQGQRSGLNRKRFLALVVTGALALALLPAGAAWAAARTVADFSITIDGGTHTFSQQRGKVMVYFFSFPG